MLSLDNPYLNDVDRATIRDNLAAYGLLGGIPIDADGDGNPDFTTAPDSFLMARANTDLTTGRADTTVELYRFVTGFDGEFGVGDRIYKWEVSANYGHSETRGRERVLVQQNFLNAVDAVDEGVFGGGAANGNIICRPGYSNANIATLSATCAPLDLFGVGRFSQAALDYVTTIADPTATNSQFVLSASVNGPLFRLPGGDVIASLGYEHRHEKTAFDPGAYYYGEDIGGGFRMPFGRSIPIDPVRGSFTTNEFSGELKIPVISPDMDSFVHAFELDGAARYIDHSAGGGDWTWTAGGRLSPVADVTIRGNFTRSVRAPAITESFSPTSLAFATANDPCDRRFVNSGPNPAQRRANCIAAGIANPDGFTSNIVGFTAPISVSGNAALRNERADSWTVGAIVRPRFVPGLTIPADWVDIRLRDAIVLLGAGQTLDACYDAVAYPAAVCGQIDRDLVHFDGDKDLPVLDTVTKGDPVTGLFRHLPTDAIFEGGAFPIKDRSNATSAMLFIGKDISESHRQMAQAEAYRKQMAEVQTRVVETLSIGMKAISAGDLTHRLTQDLGIAGLGPTTDRQQLG